MGAQALTMREAVFTVSPQISKLSRLVPTTPVEIGPVWMPMNFLLIESLQKYAHYYGDSFQVEFPTRSGNWLNLWEVSLELEKRLVGIFRRDGAGRRAFNGEVELFQNDPHWRDLLLFNEYFHGEDGRGVGASHQTGWSATVAKMINQLSRYPAP